MFCAGHRASLLGLSVCLAACAADVDDDTATSANELATAPTPRTICFAGRTWGDVMTSGGIPEIDRLCKQMPNLIRDVPGGRDAAFNFFQWNSDLAHEVDVVVGALDTNHDGVVTGADAPVVLNVVGYSWGGFNAVDFIEAMATDRRFHDDRKTVARFFALDSFRTDALVIPRKRLNVPSNVQRFYSFRHTVAPHDDCSRILFGLVGPFTGRSPYCTGSTECHDYDFSASTSGESVDHCAVPDAASPFVLGFTNGVPVSNLPTELPVARY